MGQGQVANLAFAIGAVEMDVEHLLVFVVHVRAEAPITPVSRFSG